MTWESAEAVKAPNDTNNRPRITAITTRRRVELCVDMECSSKESC